MVKIPEPGEEWLKKHPFGNGQIDPDGLGSGGWREMYLLMIGSKSKEKY